MPPRKAGTPARVTRSTSRAPGPLPAVETRQSHAYGSRGKASLNAQVTSSQAALDQAFASTREEPVEPEEPEPEPEPEQPPAASEPVPIERPVENHVKAPPRVPSTKPTSPRQRTARQPNGVPPRGLVANAAAGMRPPTRQNETGYLKGHEAQQSQEEPASIRVFLATLEQFFWTRHFWVLFAIVLSCGISWLVTASTVVCMNKVPSLALVSYTDHYCYFAARLVGWNGQQPPRSELQKELNSKFWFDLEGLNASQSELHSQVGLLSDSVAEMQRLLPRYLLVVDENGEYVIPPLFWDALIEKMSSEDSALWDRFLEMNQAKIDEYTRSSMDDAIHSGIVKHKLLSRAEFEGVLADNNRLMERRHNDTLRSFQTLVLDQAKNLAKEAAQEVYEKSPASQLAKGQLKALAYSNLVANINDVMSNTNYFSPGLGAIVQPRLTSRTWREPSRVQRVGRQVWRGLGMEEGSETAHLTVHPHTMALSDWREGGDCWCADSPADSNIKLQLGVRMPFQLYPEQLVIEHIPASGTRDIAAAPRDYEVWIKMDSAENVTKVKNLINAGSSPFSPRLCDGPPEGDGEPETWLCIGKDVYDIHQSNYVQSTFLPSMGPDIGMETWTVVLKVISNWGADHTCLYRVRMIGNEVEGYHEYAKRGLLKKD